MIIINNQDSQKFVHESQTDNVEKVSNRPYRFDVDALRGVAVSMIVLFHFQSSLIPGGFVGVDIFFVISGWIITAQMRDSMLQQKFSYASFASHRARRIAPAALVCIFGIVIVSSVVMMGKARDQALATCRAAVFSATNFFLAFFVPSGYFDESSELNPALHLWSLAVEEQFYLLWPLCMKILTRVSNRNALFSMVAVIIFSTIFGQLFYHTIPKVTYFLLITRAGELLVGASLAFLDHVQDAVTSNRILSEVCGLAGLALIGFSGWTLTSAMVFPGIAMLPPCIGAALTIIAGFNKSCTVSKVLAHSSILTVLGTISYSLYLYHWPVLSFLRYVGVDLTGIHGLSAFMYVLVASLLSFYFIESPLRRIKWKPWVIIALLFVIPSVIVFSSSVALEIQHQKEQSASFKPHQHTQKNNNNNSSNNSTSNSTVFSMQDLNSIDMRKPWKDWGRLELWDPEFLGNAPGKVPLQAMCTPRTRHVCMDGCEWNMEGSRPCPCLVSLEQCWFGDNSSAVKPSMLLLGDSNAAHYIGVLEEFALSGGFRVWSRLHPGAPPYLFAPTDIGALWKDVVDHYLSSFQVVVLACQWFSHQAEEEKTVIRGTVNELLKRNKTVILLGQVMVFPSFNIDCPNFQTQGKWSFREQACFATHTKYNLPINLFLQQMAATLPKVLYWDVNNHVCREGICSPYRHFCSHGNCANVRTYFEHSHIGYYAAKMFGDEIVREEGVPWQFIAPLLSLQKQ